MSYCDIIFLNLKQNCFSESYSTLSVFCGTLSAHFHKMLHSKTFFRYRKDGFYSSITHNCVKKLNLQMWGKFYFYLLSISPNSLHKIFISRNMVGYGTTFCNIKLFCGFHNFTNQFYESFSFQRTFWSIFEIIKCNISYFIKFPKQKQKQKI